MLVEVKEDKFPKKLRVTGVFTPLAVIVDRLKRVCTPVFWMLH